MSALLDVRGATIRFGGLTALDNFNLTVAQGLMAGAPRECQ